MDAIKVNDRHQAEIGQIVRDLIQNIEQEVNGFQSLLDALLDQQASILKGDAESVSKSNETVELIVAQTEALERERVGKSDDLSRILDMDEHLTLSEIIPLVEQSYARRLNEQKEMLETLSQKIQRTNERNRHLLSHSIQFVNKCLHLLCEGQVQGTVYGRQGNTVKREVSVFQGIG